MPIHDQILSLSPCLLVPVLALDRGYISAAEQQELYDEGEQLAKSINALRKTLR